MLNLKSPNVRSFRARKQMLALETRGRGRDGLLAALAICQPAYTGIGWLRARTLGPIDWEAWQGLWNKGIVCRSRFIRGNLGCVLREDMGLYLHAFSRGLSPTPSDVGSWILSILKRHGTSTTDRIQADLHLTRSAVRKALSDLGLRNLVMETPRDTWALTEWEEPGVAHASQAKSRARAEVVCRFLSTYGPATLREIADRFGWPTTQIQRVVGPLESARTVIPCAVDASSDIRYVRAEDVKRISAARAVQPFVSILDSFDPVVQAQKTELAARYGWGCSIPSWWFYIFVNGEWRGAFRVHYKTKLLWIREMILGKLLLADGSLTREVFQEIRRLEAKPIRIDSMNGTPPHSPMNRRILENQGYCMAEGSCFLPVAQD